MKRTVPLILALAGSQSACVVVGGYSSTGGWFIWPGSIGLILIVALLYFLFGRGR